MGLRASITVVKTGSNPSTLTPLAKNNVDTNDDVERDYRDKENTAGTEAKETNRTIEESKRKRMDESDQIRLNLDKNLETEIKKKSTK